MASINQPTNITSSSFFIEILLNYKISKFLYHGDGQFYVLTWLGYRSQLFNQTPAQVLL